MDCQMPVMNGLEATCKIVNANTGAAILMLSMHSEDTLVKQALEAGARGYVLEEALNLDLAGAIKSVGAGAKGGAAENWGTPGAEEGGGKAVREPDIVGLEGNCVRQTRKRNDG